MGTGMTLDEWGDGIRMVKGWPLSLCEFLIGCVQLSTYLLVENVSIIRYIESFSRHLIVNSIMPCLFISNVCSSRYATSLCHAS